MVIRARSRWLILVAGALMGGGYALRHHGHGAGAYWPAAVLAVAVLAAFRMRVAADDSGLTIVNLAWPRRIRWQEIEGFGMGSWRYSPGNDSLVVRLKNGKRVRGWALTNYGVAGYSPTFVDAALDDLRRRLAEANGETAEAADARAMQAALGAAEAGDYARFWDLARDLTDSEELGRQVEERGAEGRIDVSALRRAGPQLSRSAKRYLARKHPELLEDPELR